MVARGEGDMIGLARAHIADPELVRKARERLADETRRCVGGNQSCWRRRMSGLPVVCTVNPAVGREPTWGRPPEPPPASRRVLVIGGGPGGMTCADAAARRGHRLSFWERDAVLGGQVRAAAALPDFYLWGHLVEDLSAPWDACRLMFGWGRAAKAQAVLAADESGIARQGGLGAEAQALHDAGPPPSAPPAPRGLRPGCRGHASGRPRRSEPSPRRYAQWRARAWHPAFSLRSAAGCR